MTTIRYIEADGRETAVDVTDGWSLLQGAIKGNVEGILGECGGSCTCGTCHCYVDEARLGELPPPSANEEEMLGFVVAERRPNSRLACQVNCVSAFEGLMVRLPETQE
ncbi:2Fe-2S iron-sulfur cluster-binding protein [Ramlibacter sp. MAHUQ-53]|uniref:2Fe-2S iron-sulfur cluster-binding protein n=1 Tax=unclassified Ramlibacter TaxID=2617605 RepID=UPI00363D2D25